MENEGTGGGKREAVSFGCGGVSRTGIATARATTCTRVGRHNTLQRATCTELLIFKTIIMRLEKV